MNISPADLAKLQLLQRECRFFANKPLYSHALVRCKARLAEHITLIQEKAS